eukprot:scaffold114179_cov21-Tisochrysis_lutea.AAC.1
MDVLGSWQGPPSISLARAELRCVYAGLDLNGLFKWHGRSGCKLGKLAVSNVLNLICPDAPIAFAGLHAGYGAGQGSGRVLHGKENEAFFKGRSGAGEHQ